MARGRFISRRLCGSKKYAALRHDRSRVIYVLMYTWADREGRLSMEADPEEIKRFCCPYLRYSPNQIADSMLELHRIELIHIYEHDGKPYLVFEAFEEHQVGLRKDKEAPSDIPAPPKRRSKDGPTPDLLRPQGKGKGKDKDKNKNCSKVTNSLSIQFSANDRRWSGITTADLNLWKKAYPKCDIELELLRMADWIIRNWTTSTGSPGKGQKKNWPAFIRNWLAREQRRGGTARYTGDDRDLPPSLEAWVKKPKEST